MQTALRIVTTRAPGLIPSLLKELSGHAQPVILVPDSFTLACEQEIVRALPEHGFFGLSIFSPASLVREVRELTGFGHRKPVSADGQTMMISRILHHERENLRYYRDSVAQPGLARKVTEEINLFQNARLNLLPREAVQFANRRTQAKYDDVSLVLTSYQEATATAYEDEIGQWRSALERLPRSGLMRGKTLLIYGFDYITNQLTELIEAVREEADGIVIGLICDTESSDRDIFRAASESLSGLVRHLERIRMPFVVEPFRETPPMDPGIACVERTIYAYAAPDGQGTAESGDAPDMSHVHVYYAKNSYVECLHTCQELISRHRMGMAWSDMAVALCETATLPRILPLVMTACGIPFNTRVADPILQSVYGQYLFSLLRILRRRFRLEDVLRYMKTGLAGLNDTEVMDMENYARAHGIDRRRWLIPFHVPEGDEKAAGMEALRARMITPLFELRSALASGCSGREAATLLFRFIEQQGVYEALLVRENRLAQSGDELEIDRNRQSWTAANEMLDEVATFAGDERMPMEDLCYILESSLATRTIKLLPQRSNAVMIASPRMFFSRGYRLVAVMGMQENESEHTGQIFSDYEIAQLTQCIVRHNRQQKDAAVQPSEWICMSTLDLAAMERQAVYEAVSLAREDLILSAASARPNGGVLTPSTAFKHLTRLVRASCPDNVTGGLMEDGLYPFAPAFALEKLSTMLRSSKENFLTDRSDRSMLWQNALASMYQDPHWKRRVEAVFRGLHATVRVPPISREAARILSLDRGISISRIQTHNRCPYMGFVSDMLRLVPRASFTYEPNDQGTFYHNVICGFFEKARKFPEWPDLDPAQVRTLLNGILREQTRAWKNTVLNADVAHRYQGAGIIHSVRTTVESMMRAFRKEQHFRPAGLEVGFGVNGEYPGLEIPLSGNESILLSGRIDRVDTLQLEDGSRYFVIIDNKSSARDLKQNSVNAGLQLQLPLYMLAASHGLPEYQPAGALFQPVRDVLVDEANPEKILTRIDTDLRTSGMILRDPVIQEAMKPVKIGIGKNDTITAVSQDEMQRITDRALEVVVETVEDIRSGNVSPLPLQDGNVSPCSYCDHAGACPHDSRMPGGRIEILDHRTGRILT